MIKNGKYYLPPPRDGRDLKELFRLLTSAGAGRRVDKEGFPNGPWTPDLLAEAISETEKFGLGIELRTVQHWFQDNEKGISPDNIRWLARIFGCDDPEATGEWQVALSAAQRLVVAKRREKRKGSPKDATAGNLKEQTQHLFFARKCESFLGGEKTFGLHALLWAVYVAIGLLNFIFGVHSVTYSPIEGLNKQVGFLWAPTWTILPAIILPLYTIIISELLTLWKDNRYRFSITGSDGWITKIDSFSFSFWVISFVCFVFIFGFQWIGMYFRLHVEGDVGNFQIDRNLLTLVRPEIISTTKSLLVSMFGFLYTALYMWILLLGLLLMYILALDFNELCSTQKNERSFIDWAEANEFGKKVMDGVFRGSLLGLWFAICIKLQVVYLTSDDENIVSWLARDFWSAFTMNGNQGVLPGQQSMTHFTTFLLMVLICITFCASMVKIQNALKRIDDFKQAERVSDVQTSHHPNEDMNRPMFMMVGIVFFVAASMLLIGQILGFSVLLLGSAVASVYCIYDPPFHRSCAS